MIITHANTNAIDHVVRARGKEVATTQTTQPPHESSTVNPDPSLPTRAANRAAAIISFIRDLVINAISIV